MDEFKRIVCPIGFSESSIVAVDMAVKFASLSKGKLALVHIVHDPWSDIYKTEEAGKYGPKRAQERAEKMLREFAKENAAGVDCDFYVECILDGHPGRGVANFARFYGADLIIVAERQTAGLKRSRSGEITESIMTRAHCSVLTLRSYELFEESVLKGKEILVVDDEPDVLESVSEILDMCRVHTAPTFEKAVEFLDRYKYDIVILDIMGVNGFELLEKCVKLGYPAVMFTAHSLTPEAIEQSIKLGAAFLLPKDRITDLQEFLEEVVVGGGKPFWDGFFDRLDFYFKNRFGSNWKDVKALVEVLEKDN